MREEGKVGIGKLILRESQHLVSIAPLEHALVLTTMRYADEVVDVSDLKIPKAPVREKEMKLARALVDGLSEAWKPEKYDDEYRDNLLRVVRAKVAGKEPSLEEATPPKQAAVVVLMERLRASLDGGKKKRKAAPVPARRRRSA
jgi:DNA end-binding protein Ku